MANLGAVVTLLGQLVTVVFDDVSSVPYRQASDGVIPRI